MLRPTSDGISSTIVTLVLAALVVVPIYFVLRRSVYVDGTWTLELYDRALTTARFRQAARNTLIIAGSCSVLSIVLGTPLAWLVSRTDLPLRRVVRAVILAGLVAPGFVTAITWILLTGPNAGHVNVWWRSVSGSDGHLFNIYSLPGLIFVMVSTMFPLGFLFLYNAFESIDSEVEEAAGICGATQRRIFGTVTLPLAIPAIVAGLVLLFVEGLIMYSIPAIIGKPVGIPTIPTELVRLFVQYPPGIGQAAAMSLPLLGITVSLIAFQRWFTSRRSYATIRGKGGRRSLVSLGRWRWPVFLGVVVVLGVTIVLPYGLVVLASFMKRGFEAVTLDNLGLQNYEFILSTYAPGRRSIRNSIHAGSVAATVAALIAALAAYISQRRLVPWSGALGALGMAPLAVPGSVLAIGLFVSYSGRPINLYGTLTILIVAYVTILMPFAYMVCAASLGNVDEYLEDAARLSGASRWRSFTAVTVPLMKQGILGAWILVFVHATKEVTTSIFLYTSNTTVMGTALFDVLSIPNYEGMAALSTILVVITTAVVIIGYRIAGGNVLDPSRR